MVETLHWKANICILQILNLVDNLSKFLWKSNWDLDNKSFWCATAMCPIMSTDLWQSPQGILCSGNFLLIFFRHTTKTYAWFVALSHITLTMRNQGLTEAGSRLFSKQAFSSLVRLYRKADPTRRCSGSHQGTREALSPGPRSILFRYSFTTFHLLMEALKNRTMIAMPSPTSLVLFKSCGLDPCGWNAKRYCMSSVLTYDPVQESHTMM